MPSLKSLDELNKYINQQLIIAMNNVGDKAVEKMKNYVKKEFEKTTPELYKRTYEYLNSISRTEATLVYGVVVVRIGYNTDNPSNLVKIDENDHEIFPYIQGINPPLESSQDWGWHTDFWGENTSQLVPLFLEYGTDNEFYSHRGIHGLLDLEKWVKANFKKQLKIELKKLGIKTK